MFFSFRTFALATLVSCFVFSCDNKAIATQVEDCTNGKDDNKNGLIDCADSACNSNVACQPTVGCNDKCTPGASICDNAGSLRSCIKQPDGCFAFSPSSKCSNNLVCSGGTCVATCQDQCQQGAKQCSNIGAVTECTKIATGCTDWVELSSCAAGEVCSGGVCGSKQSCTNQCQVGATRCTQGSQQQTCVLLPSGCSEWTLPQVCQTNFTCASGTNACAPTNVMGCMPNQKRCNPNAAEVQTCNASGNWQTSETCSNACQNSACVVQQGPCTPGMTRCHTSQPAIEICNAQKQWEISQNCSQSCSNAQCTQMASCQPGALRCNQKQIEICNGSGSAWLYSSSCAVDCQSGLCTGQCNPNEKRCNGKMVETCNANGTMWSATETCTNRCDVSSNTCAPTSMEITMPNTPLNGLIVVDGPFTVRSGASVIASSGSLEIRATAFTVEENGAVTVTPVASATTNSVIYYNPAPGGKNLSDTNSTRIVAGTAATGHQNPAGNYSVGKGGGTLTVRASSVDVRGRLDTAGGQGTGQSHTSGYYAASGGGGGAMLIIASGNISLAATGQLNAAGGPTAVHATGYDGNAGEDGMIKLLAGGTISQLGSTKGQLVTGMLPPDPLQSSTHPREDLYYNDGARTVSFSWPQSFSSRQGYYVKFMNGKVVPSPSNGTLVTRESTDVALQDADVGQRFFNIVSVDASSVVGKIISYKSLLINAASVGITSTSHPAGAGWSTVPDFFAQWGFPQAEVSFRGALYVLDHYGDTVPDFTTGTFNPVTKKQQLFSGLTDGIWVLHMVPVDTQNNLTRQATHYNIRIGMNPGQGSLIGRVTSKDGTPLSGALVTLNRGLYTGATNSSGNFNIPNVDAANWEIYVSAKGHVGANRNITIVKAMTANADFTLDVKN